jgi:hypothetical protein
MRDQVIGGFILAGVLGCSGMRPPPTAGPVARDTLSGVRTILAEGRAGDTVWVRGLCLRLGARAALGGPPVTRSDWQLADAADSTTAIWVTGNRPSDCSYDVRSMVPVDVHAVVAVDTIGLAAGKSLRRFLWRL